MVLRTYDTLRYDGDSESFNKNRKDPFPGLRLCL